MTLGIKAREEQYLSLDPRQIPGLVAWYDGRNPGGFGVAAPADGTPLAQWNDVSGNGHHVVQATPASQPLYVAAGGGVKFDGVDDLLRCPASIPSGTDASVYAIASVLNTSANPRMVRASDGTNTNWGLSPTCGSNFVEPRFFAYDAGAVAVIAGGSTNVAGAVRGLHLHFGMLAIALTAVKAFSDGVQVGTSGSLLNNGITNPAPLNIGADASKGNPMQGTIYDILIYNQQHQAALVNYRHRISQWLAARHGIALAAL